MIRKWGEKNSLKITVLRVLAKHGGWMRPSTIWIEAGAPARLRRVSYTYLKRLFSYGLLQRKEWLGRLAYRISDAGRRTLAWYESQKVA